MSYLKANLFVYKTKKREKGKESYFDDVLEDWDSESNLFVIDSVKMFYLT